MIQAGVFAAIVAVYRRAAAAVIASDGRRAPRDYSCGGCSW